MVGFVGLFVMEHAARSRRRGAQHGIGGTPAADARGVAARRNALIPAFGISRARGLDRLAVAGFHLATGALVRRRIAEAWTYVREVHGGHVQRVAAELSRRGLHGFDQGLERAR